MTKLPTIQEVQAEKARRAAAKTPPKPEVKPEVTVAAKPEETKPEGEKKKTKTKKVTYPGLKPDVAGKGTAKLTAWPTDHDEKQHLPLRKSDFENEAPWLIHRAEFLEGVAKRLRVEAEQSLTLGNKADRVKAKRLTRLQDQMAAVRAELAASGVDVDKLMAGVAMPKAAATTVEKK